MRKTGLLVLCFLLTVACLTGCETNRDSVLVYDETAATTRATTVDIPTIPTFETIAPANPAYTKLFEDFGLYVVDPVPYYGMTSHRYAQYDKDNDLLACYTIGCDGDTIRQIEESYYWRIPEGITTETKNQWIQEKQSGFKQYDDLNCGTVTHTDCNWYYRITLCFDDIDNLTAVQELYSVGYADRADSLMSLALTESFLLSEGYVKR